MVMKTTSDVQELNIPQEFALYQNFPNPFNPSTTISFDLPNDINVRVEIFDINGRKIHTLVNEPKESGTHHVIWNGEDDRGTSVASGVYVYRIQAGDFVQSKKLLFMK
jgi:flagellar hook assembly protein FlgD